MNFGINIEFGFDELPGDGICSVYKLPIEGVMFVPYIQVGDVKDAKYLDPICSNCHENNFSDNTESSVT